jgi:deoxyribose-phosphate aldolase
MHFVKENVLTLIDHTELSAGAGEREIDKACRTTIKYRCAAVCVRPEWVKHAKNNLVRHDIPVATVIGFPEGTIEYVKTSTGAHPNGGATPEAVALIRASAPHIGIKASGGVGNLEQAERLIAAGATRIGSSNTANF